MSIDSKQLLVDSSTHRHEIIWEDVMFTLIIWTTVKQITDCFKESCDVLISRHLQSYKELTNYGCGI